jgi:hypothetical protein
MYPPDRLTEWPPIIAVDFDGVLHRKDPKDWRKLNEPMDGAVWGMRTLYEAGFQIIIHTVRACDRIVGGELEPNQLNELKIWLGHHQIVYDTIWTGKGKPLAHFFLDDKGVRFETWGTSVPVLLQMVRDMKLRLHLYPFPSPSRATIGDVPTSMEFDLYSRQSEKTQIEPVSEKHQQESGGP